MQVRELVESAEKVTGGPTALAKRLGIPDSHVSGWKSGARSCSAVDRAVLAELIGNDAAAELLAATAEKHAGTPKGDLLKAALKKAMRAASAATVPAFVLAALSFAFAPRTAEAGPASQTRDNVYYVK